MGVKPTSLRQWWVLLHYQAKAEKDLLYYTIGRRGLVLLLLGGTWLVYGLLVGFYGSPDPHGNPPLTSYIPHQFRGLLWGACGVISIWYAFKRKPGEDWVGFAAMGFPPLLYAASGLVSTIAGLLLYAHIHTYPVPENPWVSLIVYGAFGALTRVIAGWPEPQLLRRRKPDNGG